MEQLPFITYFSIFKEDNMKKISRKLVALALTLAFALALLVPGGITEAAVKTVTAKIDVSGSTYKNCKSIGVGSTRVTFAATKTVTRPGVKFTAPKAGTYRITVSSVKAPTGVTTVSGINGLIDVRQVKEGYTYPTYRTVSTAYGHKTSTLWICNQRFFNSWYSGKSGAALTEALKKNGAYLKDRSFPIKLKKGESVYLGGYFSYSNAKTHATNHAASCIVKVEKVN